MLAPKQSIVNNDLCPVCGRKLTVGVLHRVENLADRPEGSIPDNVIPYKCLVPLEEIIAQAIGAARDTAGVRNRYDTLVKALGGEFNVLMNAPVGDIEQHSDERIALGVANMRSGKVLAQPGYDGVFGVINVFAERAGDKRSAAKANEPAQPAPARPAKGEQMSLF